MAEIADFEFERGSDALLTDTITPTTNISGWTITFTMKRDIGGSALITKTVGSGITITSAAGGVFTIAINMADTQSLEPRTYVFDICRTNAGFETVLTKGVITLLPGVLI